MNKPLSRGRTVLISGPASVVLTNGKVAALGFQLPLRKKIIIRKNKAIPFEAEEDSTLEIVLSDDASIEEIDGSTIPDSWKATVEALIKLPKPCTVLVIGDVDCGKNAFCICLVNYALASGLKPTVIDADIGQSEIGPPTAVGSTSVSEQTLDFFSLNAEHVFFVGLTSPSGATDRTIEGIAFIRRHISGTSTHLVVVNTDGWIKEEIARQYKSKLIRTLGPEAIVAIQSTDELEQILGVASETSKVFRAASPQVKGRRGKETRKELREQGYRKYLEGATTRRLPMKWVRFDLSTFGSGTPLTPSKLRELEKVLGYRTLYCEENPKELLVVTDEAYAMNVEQVENVKKCFGKSLRIIGEGDLAGLLIGLFDERRRFLGLGVIDRIDCKGQILKIMTPCKEKVDIIQFGQVKLDKHGKEIGHATVLSD